MKKVLLGLICVIGLSFAASCSSDDNSNINLDCDCYTVIDVSEIKPTNVSFLPKEYLTTLRKNCSGKKRYIVTRSRLTFGSQICELDI